MMDIALKIIGNKTEARCHFIDGDKSEEIIRWARNGAEAASLVIKHVQRTYGRGFEYRIPGTPIKGRT